MPPQDPYAAYQTPAQMTDPYASYQAPAGSAPPATSTEPKRPGFFSRLGEDLLGVLKPAGYSPYPGMDQEAKSAAATDAYQQDQNRKKEGYSTPYRMLAPVAQSVGVNVPGMEESAKQGDVGGVLGHAAAVPTMLATAAGLHAGVPKLMEAAKGPLKASGIGLSPVEKLVKSGGPSVTERNFPESLQKAAPHLVEQNSAKPIQTVQDVADASHTAADSLWKNEIEPQVGRHADEPVNGKAVAQEVRSGIDPGTRDLFPEQAKTAEDFAQKFDGDLPLSKANDYLKAINAQLKSYYKMSPEAQHAAGVTSGRISSLENASNALRDQIYGKLEALGENDPRGARQQYGALKQVQKVFEKRAIVSGRQAPMNLPQAIALLGGAGEAAGALLTGHPGAAVAGAVPPAIATILRHINSPDSLARRGINGLVESGVKAPAKTPPSLVLTPPAGRTPGLSQPGLFDNLTGQFGERLQPHQLPEQDLNLTSPGDMPPALQRVLGFTQRPVESEAHPGLHPKSKQGK